MDAELYQFILLKNFFDKKYGANQMDLLKMNLIRMDDKIDDIVNDLVEHREEAKNLLLNNDRENYKKISQRFI